MRCMVPQTGSVADWDRSLSLSMSVHIRNSPGLQCEVGGCAQRDYN